MTEQGTGERQPYRLDTEIIPPGVDLSLAIERNRTIQAWRDGYVTSGAVHEALLRLYWTTADHAGDETRHYLMGGACDFPVEADIDFDESDKTYMKIQDDPDAYPYIRIFRED